MEVFNSEQKPKWLIPGIVAAAVAIAFAGLSLSSKNKPETDTLPEYSQTNVPVPEIEPGTEPIEIHVETPPEVSQEEPKQVDPIPHEPEVQQSSLDKNFIVNGSFENGLAAWDHYGNADTTIVKLNAKAPDGEHAVRMQSINTKAMSILSTRIDAKWGDRVIVTGMAKTKAETANYPITISMRVVGTERINKKPIQFAEVKITGTSDWTKHFIDEVLPSEKEWPGFGDLTLLLMFSNPEQHYATAFFDNIQVHVLKPDDPDFHTAIERPVEIKAPASAAEPDKPLSEKTPDQETAQATEKTPPESESMILEKDMAELVLTVISSTGKKIAPKNYTLYINGKQIEPVPGTFAYHFQAGDDVTFEVVAKKHKGKQFQQKKVPAISVKYTIYLEEL